jgi:chitinase
LCKPSDKYSTDLAYYEIEAILVNDSSIDVIWDHEAAAKYFTWDSNQWISYDDADTFAQKVDWANEVDISGSLIWASDLGRCLLDSSASVTFFSSLSTNRREIRRLHLDST